MAISLSSIERSKAKPPRIIVYSDAGVGKTTFAASAPEPIFLITEDGLGLLDVPHFPLAKSLDDILDALGALYSEDHAYQTMVLDSLDWLEPLIWERVCRDHGIKSIEGMGYGKGYVEAISYWRQVYEGLTALRDQRGMTVIMTAHSQIVHIEDPTQPAYDAHGLKLHKRAAALAEEFSDIILFCAYRTMTHSEDLGFGNKRTRAVTTGERIMYAQGTPAFTAKNRHHLPTSLPLSWDALVAAMQQQPTTQPNAA